MPIDYSKWDRLAASLSDGSESNSSSSPEREVLEGGFAALTQEATLDDVETEKRQIQRFVSLHPCPDEAKVTAWVRGALGAGLLDTTQDPLRRALQGFGYDVKHFDYDAFQCMWKAAGQDMDKDAQRVVGEMLSAKGGLRCMQLNYYVFMFALGGQYFYRGPRPAAVRGYPRMLEFWWHGIGEWQM